MHLVGRISHERAFCAIASGLPNLNFAAHEFRVEHITANGDARIVGIGNAEQQQVVGLAAAVVKVQVLTHFQAFKPYVQGQIVGIAKLCLELNGLERISRVVEVQHELFVVGLALEYFGAGLFFGSQIDLCERFKRRTFCAGSHGAFPVRAKGALIDPVGRETERQLAKLALQKVAESIVAILIDVQACAAHFVGKFTFRHARNLTQYFKQVAHFVPATPLPRASNSQKGRVPGDLRAGVTS